MSLGTPSPTQPKGTKRSLSPYNYHDNYENHDASLAGLRRGVLNVLSSPDLLNQLGTLVGGRLQLPNDPRTQDAIVNVISDIIHQNSRRRSHSPTSTVASKRARTDHGMSPTSNSNVPRFPSTSSAALITAAHVTNTTSSSSFPMMSVAQQNLDFRTQDWAQHADRARIDAILTGQASQPSQPSIEFSNHDSDFASAERPRGFQPVNNPPAPPSVATIETEPYNSYRPPTTNIDNSSTHAAVLRGPNACSFCFKSLNSPSAKQEHEAVHIKELNGYKRHACVRCDYKHVRARDVLMHMKKRHQQPGGKQWQLHEVKDNGPLPDHEIEKLKKEFIRRKDNKNNYKFVHQGQAGPTSAPHQSQHLQAPSNGVLHQPNGGHKAPASSIDGSHLGINTSMAPASHSQTVSQAPGNDTQMGDTSQEVDSWEYLGMDNNDDPWFTPVVISGGYMPFHHGADADLEGLGSGLPAPPSDMPRSLLDELDLDLGSQSSLPILTRDHSSVMSLSQSQLGSSL